jgi:hypothetical protein
VLQDGVTVLDLQPDEGSSHDWVHMRINQLLSMASKLYLLLCFPAAPCWQQLLHQNTSCYAQGPALASGTGLAQATSSSFQHLLPQVHARITAATAACWAANSCTRPSCTITRLIALCNHLGALPMSAQWRQQTATAHMLVRQRLANRSCSCRMMRSPLLQVNTCHLPAHTCSCSATRLSLSAM